MFRGAIEDRLAIRERFDSYAGAVTRGALDDYLDCWTADGARRGVGGECQGIDALRAHWDGIWKALAQMSFITQIGSIEVDGDHAAATSFCLENFRLHDNTTRQLVGAYDDRLRKVDGVWRFSERRYRILLENL